MLPWRIFQFDWLTQLISSYETHRQTIKKSVIAAIIIFNISCISICVSAFLFGTVYFYHMPTIQHSFPLYFHYNRTCIQQHKVVENGLRWDRYVSSAYSASCFPVAKVDISTPTNSKLLQEGQVYSAVLKLELPETPQNLDMGMFMVNMTVKGQPRAFQNPGEYRWTKRRPLPENENLPIVKSFSKPMRMKYKSSLVRLGYTILLWPLLVFDFMHESQVLDEVLFEKLLLEQKSYYWTASIYIESPSIDVYTATLDIMAKFTGVQYLLYRWPIVSFLFGTLTFFLPTLFTNVIIFYFLIWRPFFGAEEATLQPQPDTPPASLPPVVESIPPVLEEALITNPETQEHPPTSDDSSDPFSSSTAPKTLQTAPASSVGVISRRSSSSLSIEMIGQPSHFSLIDDNEPGTSRDNLDVTMAGDEEPPHSGVPSEGLQSDARCVRRWVVARQPSDSS